MDDDERKFHGQMQNPMSAAMYPPLRMLRNRGKIEVRSHPALSELAATLVPSCAMTKPMAMKAIPARIPRVPSVSRRRSITSSGFHTKSPKISFVEDPIKMPMREVIAKQTGSEMICGRITSDGLDAREAKSTACRERRQRKAEG